MNSVGTPELAKLLELEGCYNLRLVNGVMCGLRPFALKTGLMVDLREFGYGHHYIYEFEADALAALNVWPGEGHPSGPWVRCKGQYLDLLNPALEQTNLG